ncbi:MAG: hypothetical protein ACJ74Z_01615 [Bryobacteraceae bacterium]
MSVTGLVSIRNAIGKLNPKQVREMSDRSLRIALYSASPEGYQRMENFFLHELKPIRRRDSSAALIRTPAGSAEASHVNLAIYDQSVLAPRRAFVFESDRPEALIHKILEKHQDLGVALAKHFPPFRRPFVDRVIKKTCRENTLFSLATALPDVIPSIIELPWAIAEFASDTAFLTMNQIRMAFLIAAASDREVGYAEQKSEIATVIGSAFGWRALARQVVSKIPFGGGLLGKAAVAYAGTKVLGLSLERFYNIGYNYTREERDRLYADAFRQGKEVAARILTHLRPDVADRYASESAREQTINVPPNVPPHPASGA